MTELKGIDIEIPDGLNPKLIALGWLVGVWEGTGNGIDHEGNDFTFEQRIEFTHNGGDYLFSVSQAFGQSEGGAFDVPLGMEAGFWRPEEDASLVVTTTHSDGWTEVLIGTIQVTSINLRTDAVVRTESASVSHASGQRIYGKFEGDLMYALDRSTADHELRPHMWARLTKQQ